MAWQRSSRLNIAWSLGALLCLAGPAGAQAAGPDPFGDWARQDGLSRIKISACGSQICAVNTWVRDPNGSEKLGDRLVMTLHESSPTELSGRAHDERRDMTYAMTIDLGSGSMRTHGCIMLGLLCRTAQWTRLP